MTPPSVEVVAAAMAPGVALMVPSEETFKPPPTITPPRVVVVAAGKPTSETPTQLRPLHT